MAKLRSRRIIEKEILDEEKEEKKEFLYCRKCQENKKPTDFHDAVDHFLDKNGKFSICKECINLIFDGFMKTSGNSISESIYKTCRTVNVLYSEKVVESLKLHLSKNEEKGRSYEPFGLYKSHLGKYLSLNKSILGIFEENVVFMKPENEKELEFESEDFKEYLKKFWGDSLLREDYEYLESELARWKKTHSCQNAAEETLLREICFNNLEIRKARTEGKETGTLVKKLQELMKTANLANQSASGNSQQETFGLWIKEIEQTTPAEWWEDHQIFKDVDGVIKYIENYFVRAIRNFITSTKDFRIDDFDSEEETDFEEENEVSEEQKTDSGA
jgi:hypothetical protein